METKTVKFNELKLKELETQPDIEVKNNLDHAIVVTTSFQEMINLKQELTLKLKEAAEKEITAKLNYEQEFNERLLNTKFEEKLNKSRPNKDEKEAYIHNQIKEIYAEKIITEENTKIIKRQLELIDNRISLEKTILNLVQTSGGLYGES